MTVDTAPTTRNSDYPLIIPRTLSPLHDAVYRWAPPDDLSPLDRMLDMTVARQLHAVTFTSAPVTAGVLARAQNRDMLDKLLTSLRHDVVAACVGR